MGPFLCDTSTDTVRALDLFGPDPAEPDSPIFEFARVRILTAMLDCDARGVTDEDNISRIANDLIKPIDLLLRCRDEAAKRFTKRPYLTLREDARSPTVGRIDAVR